MALLQCSAHPSRRGSGLGGEEMTPAAAAGGRRDVRLSDAQIASLLEVVITFETERGNVALDRSRNGSIRSFAQMMIEYQGELRRVQGELSKRLELAAGESPAAVNLRAEYVNALTRLRGADAAEFDAAYVSTQIEALQKTRSMLDESLLPSVEDQELWQLLQIIRLRTDVHLSQALELRQALRAAP